MNIKEYSPISPANKEKRNPDLYKIQFWRMISWDIFAALEQRPEPVERVAVITLRPTRNQQRKKVVWTEDTIDNENMNKKKSKCCCIYEKPHRFGESDSEDSDDECEHCFGHVERKHKKHHTATVTTTEIQETVEQTASITLQQSEPAPAPPDRPPTNG